MEPWKLPYHSSNLALQMLPGNFGPQWAPVTVPRLPTTCAPTLADISKRSADWASGGRPALVLAMAGGQAANNPCQCWETWQVLARRALWACPALEPSVAP